MQLFLLFIILTFIYSSSCFGRPHAHHQELNNCSSSLWFYLRSVVIAVLLVVVGQADPTTINSTGLSVLWVAYATHSTLKPSSNSSTIAADSSNGVTNTRCCRYSCFTLLMMGGVTTRNMYSSFHIK